MNAETGEFAPDINVSFEFFPPKTEKMEQTLWKSVNLLQGIGPSFVSVTYGAGGTTRERTHDIVTRLQKQNGLQAAAHLTCVGATREEINEIAQQYWDAGIRHIVALRGDPQEGIDAEYKPYEGGYAFASDLVAGLKEVADFEISVAGYPEKHPEAVNIEDDIECLKRKVDAGADRVITQFFLNHEHFLRFRDRAADVGITCPILPGILPISNFSRTIEFANKCGAEVPHWMESLFVGLDDNLEAQKMIAAAVATEQCRKLYDENVRHFHFYTLNRAELTLAICRMLGLQPSLRAAA